MHPHLITIGNFSLPTYGVLVAAAFLVGITIAGRLARRSGLDPEKVASLAVYAAIAGLAGAKLLLVILDLDSYLANPASLVSTETLRAAGVFHGGLIAALLTAFLYMRHYAMPPWKTLDVLAPAIAIGHAIGRLGCFAAGCCWGVACERPWAVTFTDPEAQSLTGVPLHVPLHPTQLYESAAEAFVFAFLYYRFGKAHRAGAILGWYLVLSSALRFGVEFVRAHQQALPFGGPLSSTQWIALGLLGLGLWLLLRPGTGSTGQAP